MTTAERHPADVAADEIPAETIVRWHAAIAGELREAFEACLPGNRFTLGPQLAAFEAEFATYCETGHGIGVSSGTAALALALRALGVGPGDEVITVPNTYVATVFAITYVGAVPVFVDVDPMTANMDPARVAAAVTLAHEGDPARPPVGPVRGRRRHPGRRARHPGARGRGPCPRRDLPRPQGGRSRGPGRLQLLSLQGDGRPR